MGELAHLDVGANGWSRTIVIFPVAMIGVPMARTSPGLISKDFEAQWHRVLGR